MELCGQITHRSVCHKGNSSVIHLIGGWCGPKFYILVVDTVEKQESNEFVGKRTPTPCSARHSTNYVLLFQLQGGVSSNNICHKTLTLSDKPCHIIVKSHETQTEFYFIFYPNVGGQCRGDSARKC